MNDSFFDLLFKSVNNMFKYLEGFNFWNAPAFAKDCCQISLIAIFGYDVCIVLCEKVIIQLEDVR